ncbi:MAG: hypothetical protein JWM93_3876, partial [Frankiales bacterium]|nr:hypothetical protein [Frankiales bacterium]
VPIVSAAAGAYSEHDVSGLIHEPADVAALTDHLHRVADAATLERLRAGALANREELTWDAAARVVVGHYEHALDALRST